VTALLIIGHGTRDEAGAQEFRRFAERVGRRAAERPELSVRAVAGGFIELSPPPVKDAVAGLVAAGTREMVAVPLILLAAGHAKGDIPAALARERDRHPGLRTRYARPLGVHPVILSLLRERLADCPQLRPDAVLLVGRGTTDPDANADLYRAARLLWETTRDGGIDFVEPAFVSLARPSVREGLERLYRLGARRITVLPYFLFRGVLPDRIVEQSAEAAADLGIDVAVAGLIGDCDALADLVLERYAEAARGPVAVNCDACVYRIALPGFEHRVGAAQRPHDHPDDPAHQHAHPHHPNHSQHDELGAAHVHPHSHEHAHEHAHESAAGPGRAPAVRPEPGHSDQSNDSRLPGHAGAPSVR
jgi:sirohydrochlorin cobaltochelatase